MPLVTDRNLLMTLKHESNLTHQRTLPDMSRVTALILGGGQGTRLFPLTQMRCKPAILFGGKFRLIDVPISNALNSHIQKNFIITQFLSSSLHQHIFHTYRTSSFSNGFVEVLGVEEKPNKTVWFKGTADAVRQNLEYLIDTPADYFLILSGDQLYHMNFQYMVQYAIQKDVDVLVATLAVNEKDAQRMGIMKVNEDNHIIDFCEKPNQKLILDRLKTPASVLDMMGLEPTTERQFLGSMGIYLFKRAALFHLLKEDAREDFGKHLIPSQVTMGRIAAFPHLNYWEDIGTIESFYKANLLLCSEKAPFSLYDENFPIYTRQTNLPGPRISSSHVANSIICEGSIVEAEELTNSLLGQRTHIKKGSIIRDSYLMGNDFYSCPVDDHELLPKEPCIEANCIIKGAIIDRNVHIGNGVQLVNKNKLREYDSPYAYIREGIIVVPRNTTIPAGFVL